MPDIERTEHFRPWWMETEASMELEDAAKQNMGALMM